MLKKIHNVLSRKKTDSSTDYNIHINSGLWGKFNKMINFTRVSISRKNTVPPSRRKKLMRQALNKGCLPSVKALWDTSADDFNFVR